MVEDRLPQRLADNLLARSSAQLGEVEAFVDRLGLSERALVRAAMAASQPAFAAIWGNREDAAYDLL